jgi:hypothetical protein
MTDLLLMSANARAAFSNLGLVKELAEVGPEALPVIAEQLDSVAGSLGRLTGLDAQRVIGPGVNIATTARQRVVEAAALAHDGTMFSMPLIDNAHRSAGQLALNLEQRIRVSNLGSQTRAEMADLAVSKLRV